MSKISKSDFIALLKKSRIMDLDRLDQWLEEGDEETANQVAARLVRDQIATKWQAKYLMSGRARLDVGSYRLLERIEQGELGDRFLAIHNSLQRKVDIQILPSTLTKNESRREEFMQKASLAAKLDHPNLIHVYDIDQEGGRYYLVTEHVEGKTLEATSRTSLSETDVARITFDALNGVAYAHEHDVIHGCISQADLVLTKHNQVKIQNLPLSPLRQQLAGIEDAPRTSKDFSAIIKIGSTLLDDVSVLNPTNEELAGIFADIDPDDAESVRTATQSLATWLMAHETVCQESEIAPAADGSFDQPVAATSLPRKQKVLAADGEESEPVEELAKPGYLGRLWHDNPVAVIVTSAVLALMLIGGSVFAGIRLLNNSGAEVAKKLRDEAPDQSAQDRVSANANTIQLLNRKSKKKNGSSLPTEDEMKEFMASLPGGNSNLRPVEPKPKTTRANRKAFKPATAKPKPKIAKPNSEVMAVAAVDPAPQGEQLIPAVVANPPGETAESMAGPQPAPALATRGVGEPSVPDELRKISGIGPKIQAVFYEGGITTYKQLASMDPSEINALLKKANVVYPNQKPESWIAQAKQLSGDTSPISTAAPAESSPKPNDVDAPFAEFPRITELPAIEDTTEFKIADLKIKPQYLLGANIICEEGISKTRLIFELNRTPEDKQKWMVGVKRREREQPTEIAIFRKSENAFHFQWLPEAAKNKFAPFLRNCFLKLTLPDGQSAFLTLRQPIKIRDLRLTPESLVNQLSFTIPAMPNPETIVVEVLPLKIKGVETAVPISRIERGIPGVIWLKRSDKTGFLWIQITGEIRSKLRLQSNLMLLVKGQATPVTNLKTLDELGAFLERQAAASQGVYQRFESTAKNNPADNKTKEELASDAKKKLDAKMKLIEYRETLSKVLNQPITVRVYSKLGNFQTKLAVMDSTMPQEK